MSAVALLLSVGLAVASQAPVAEPDGFKVVFHEFDVRNKEVLRGEIVVAQGRWYQFDNHSNEIVVYDLKQKRLDLIDLGRRTRTLATFQRLDAWTEKLKQAITSSIERREKEGGKGNEVAAKMTRDLLSPAFQVVFDDASKISRLTNATVQVEAKGSADLTDAEREALGQVLAYQAKLEATRNPTKIPPFCRLETLTEVVSRRKLRPSEIVMVYRLAGPPLKERRVYEVERTLTDRDRRGIARIIQLYATMKTERFETYEGISVPK